MQVQAAGLGHFLSFFVVLVLPEEYTFRDVALALPAVGRMSFLYIDHEKLALIFVTAIYFSQASHLGAKGGSSVTAEDKCHWAFISEAG